MRAVNLIPDEQRRGAGGTSGRSGGVAFVVIGVLAGIVALVAVYAMSSATITTRQAKLDALKQQVVQTQTADQQLQAYTAFAALRDNRVGTISQIAETRFDWAHAMQEIPRVLPDNVWLESISGTITPTTSADGTSSDVAGEPAIDIQGCSTGQDQVATLMTALEQMDGIDQVNLIKSGKTDTPDPDAGSCQVRQGYPAFDITLSFKLPGLDPGSSTDAEAKTYVQAAAVTSAASSPAATTEPAVALTSGGGAGQG